MLLIAPYAASVAADPPKLTDELTAWGTVGLAFVTVIALAVTIWLARRDRNDAQQRLADELKRAETDRAESERRLREEREAADQRLRDERAEAERQRLRERQIANAVVLIAKIAALHPFLELASAPAPMVPPQWSNAAQGECDQAIGDLQAAGRSEALLLTHPVATKLYSTLVHLVVSARGGHWMEQGEQAEQRLPEADLLAIQKRIVQDLRAFSRYVRLWLAALIDGVEIPEDVLGPFASTGNPLIPVLGGAPHAPGWTPQSYPPGWNDDRDTDPEDPQFRPAR